MEITPRRSLSLNLEFTNKYFGISTPIREMWTAQNINTMEETHPSSYKMSHSLSMDDNRVNPTLHKKNNIILRSMIGIFGSLGNMVSKIPSFMSSINNPLSVTVVSNEGIISPEYILKNLTNSGDQDTLQPLPFFNEIQDNSSYNPNSNVAEIFTEKVRGKHFLEVNGLANSWIQDLQGVQESMNSFNESNDLNLAIQESLKINTHNNYVKDTPLQIIDTLQDQNLHMKPKGIEKELIRIEEEKKSKCKIDENIHKIKESPGAMVSAVDNSLDRMVCEIPSKRPHLHKTRRKPNIIARSRGKAKGKYQLRKSGVSQSKHRKERTKQNLYSNIQDDLSAWEEWDDDSLGENYDRIPSVHEKHRDTDVDANIHHIPEYPMFVDTFVLGESGRTLNDRKFKAPDRGKLSYRMRFPPDCKENILSPITHDFRQRLLSESSIDSEDSCCIIFQDESEYESENGSCGREMYEFDDSSDEEQGLEKEEEEENRPEQKVRFNLEPTIHTMIQWNYAYRAARRGPWEQMARDRDRFRGRINCIGRVLDPILTVEHRECIWHDRFSVNESIEK
ncbi:uncharacterized protein LOC135168027 isoform X1 [Diachasmimorpha longicaudata]|uniref:uncharacterized protein LOC135168027 isoform X1 n=1 Tax=Diachasmimorpha longicaudata TaxID=58733 RepID=UPI0030B86FB2